VEKNSHGLMVGSTGTYKSFLCFHLAFSIIRGIPFFGMRNEQQGKVLYVAGEGGNASRQRARAYVKKHGQIPTINP